MSGTNQMSSLVFEFFEKKMLGKMGYQFSCEDLTQFEVDAYSVIALEITKLEQQEAKKTRPRK